MEQRQFLRLTDRALVRGTLIVLALVSLVLLAWQLRGILMLVFGAVLVAVIFRALAQPIRRITGMPDGLAVGIAVLLVAGVLVLVGWLFGAEMAAQVRTLIDILPGAWQSFEFRVGDYALGEQLRAMVADATPSGTGLLTNIGGVVLSLGTAITDTLIVLVGGIYLAMQPRLYRTGTLKLVPKQRRGLIAEAMDHSGNALRLWLKGQLISMTVIGFLTGLGLWLLDVPSAIALGLLAGLLEFIPLAGPVLAAIPALLIALAVDPSLALWVLGLYIVIQQIEGNVLQPVVQQYAVDLPAVILLFSLLAFATLFGVVGIILAAPLTVVVYVMVKRLYVREVLDTPTPVPGEDEEQAS
ncbi:AI-2E family transporter [Porphyrobacter sp. GA68]|uniref:AI-2E family transporter n=1 Tax=Porphyrobacter sp. GA68 TaxID=2883480 RepID=UPI001D18D42C|nr:AI-2E family transporter [Porphyrobacter sp. GA68]